MGKRLQKCPGTATVSEKEPALSNLLKSGDWLGVALSYDLERHWSDSVLILSPCFMGVG